MALHSKNRWPLAEKLFIFVAFWVIIALVDASPLSGGPWGPTDPMADPSATVIVAGPSGSRIRFTVLTDRMIRVEQSSSASTSTNNDGITEVVFEDRKTVAVINRKLPVPSFQQSQSSQDGIFTIKTDCLTVAYLTGEAFSATSLTVTGKMYCSLANNYVKKATLPEVTSPVCSWTYRYGEDDPNNLLGTIRTLDGKGAISLNCTEGDHRGDHCEWGLISRSGYAVVNDTMNFALSDDRDWWDGPNRNQEDIYLLGHGHDYNAALSDYRLIGGSIPLLPRYAFGVWFSRWYDYTAASAAQIVRRYEELSLPLDVFVFDMNWHTKNDWTGYSWDKRLYGNPEDAVAYMKARGLAVTLNLHDAQGIDTWEDQYENMCRAVGCAEGDRILFSIVNETIAYASEDMVLAPLESNGVDFWWIDWQQGEAGRGGAAGGKQNPTIWTAHIKSTNSNRRKQKNKEVESQRNMVLARWGGLGAHRYPVHFSGDVNQLSWDNLAYQPYFSMTATNVGAIWSHDIEGPSEEPELYTRWLQWGVVSGVVRTHDRGMSTGGCAENESCSIVEPWNVPPKYAQANFEALRLRGRLIPYLYTAAYHAHKRGRWFTTPMYYNWPEFDGAYETAGPRPNPDATYDPQYMLGDDTWVAPVVKPSNKTDGLARLNLWIPPGTWVGAPGGEVVIGADDGTTSLAWLADLNDIPMFARAGSIVPSIAVRSGATIGLAMKPYDELIWTIYLASGGPISGIGTLYEDDGISTAYHDRSSFTVTSASYNISNSIQYEAEEEIADETIRRRRTQSAVSVTKVLKFSVSTDGHSEKNPTSRATTLRLVNMLPPASVVANGLSIQFSRFGGKGSWSFDSKDAAVVVELPFSQVAEGLEIVVETTRKGLANDAEFSVDGIGFQLQRAIAAKAAMDDIRKTPGSQTGQDKLAGHLLLAASSGSSLEYSAGLTDQDAFETVLKSYQLHFDGAYHELQQMDVKNPRVARAQLLLESALER